MQWIMKICARGVIGLGTAALLLSGVPAHANPASGAASQESQPRLLAQTKTPPGEAEKLEKLRQEEQQKKVQKQQEQQKNVYDRGLQQQQGQQKKAKMRGPMPEAAREAMPPEPGAKRFDAGVIRKSEKPVDEE